MNYWVNIGDKLLNNLISLISDPSWPQLLLLMALLLLCFFHKNISNLIDRIKRITHTGVDFHIQPEITPLTVEELEKTQTTFYNLTSLSTIKHNLTIIKKYLSQKKINDISQSNDFLTHELAEVIFILRCERVYYIIFGSQIQLLKRLLLHQATGLSHQIINEHFENILKIYPDFFAKSNNILYLNFLKQANLIVERENYYITDFGADFLTWLQRSGYPENKSF